MNQDFHNVLARQVTLAGHPPAGQNVHKMETVLQTLHAQEKNVSTLAPTFVDSMPTVKLSIMSQDVLAQKITMETHIANVRRCRKSFYLLSQKNQLIPAGRHHAEVMPTVNQLATEQFASANQGFLEIHLLPADPNAFLTVNVRLTRLASTRSVLTHVRAPAASMPFVTFTIILQFACAKKDSLEILLLAVN